MEDNSGRPTNEMLIHETQEPDLEQKSKCSKKTKIIIIAIAIFILLCGIAIALYFALRGDNSGDNNDYDPIPKHEDLDFTEEAHRLLSREVATQTMVLASNKDNTLPLRQTDQVVLFGNGTQNTIYGGWGSGEVYKKGTTKNLSPVTILEGIENCYEGNFIYIPNKKGYEIGLEGSNLTEADVENFSIKTEGAERTEKALVYRG